MDNKEENIKVLLVGGEKEENLSIRYLAGMLEREDHKVKISQCSDYNQFSQVLDDISKFNPHIIGISIPFQCLTNLYFDLITEIRKSNYKGHITLGGHFPTFEFKEILKRKDGVDSVVRFEGEKPIIELAESINNNFDLSSVTNLVYREDGEIRKNKCFLGFQELDRLPFPKREEKPRRRLGEKFGTLVASRGCWHSSCLYCCIGAYHSKKDKKFTLRSPESVAKEISKLYKNKGVRIFQFHDDNFMLPKKKDTVKRVNNLKKAMENRGVDLGKVAFLIKARPGSINEDVASSLKELGVTGIFLGIENASESGLKSLIRGLKLEDVYNSLSILKKYNFGITFNLLIFHPKATLEEIDENIAFIKKYKQFPFDFGRAEVVAASPLERMLKNQNKLKGEWPNWDYSIDDDLVEKIFKINLKTFRRSRSKYARLAHSSIALGYHGATIKRLYPGTTSDKLNSKANELITKINSLIVNKIEKIRNLAVNSPSKRAIENLNKDLSVGCEKYLKEIKNLTNKMVRLQITEKTFQRFGIEESIQEFPLLRKLFFF